MALNSEKIFFVETSSKICVEKLSILIKGFIFLSLSLATSALSFQMSSVVYKICRLRLDRETLSPSSMPILPTPTEAR